MENGILFFKFEIFATNIDLVSNFEKHLSAITVAEQGPKNSYIFAFSSETNLIKKCIQSYQTVAAVNTSRVLPINSNLHAFFRIKIQLSLLCK